MATATKEIVITGNFSDEVKCEIAVLAHGIVSKSIRDATDMSGQAAKIAMQANVVVGEVFESLRAAVNDLAPQGINHPTRTTAAQKALFFGQK